MVFFLFYSFLLNVLAQSETLTLVILWQSTWISTSISVTSGWEPTEAIRIDQKVQHWIAVNHVENAQNIIDLISPVPCWSHFVRWPNIHPTNFCARIIRLLRPLALWRIYNFSSSLRLSVRFHFVCPFTNETKNDTMYLLIFCVHPDTLPRFSLQLFKYLWKIFQSFVWAHQPMLEYRGPKLSTKSMNFSCV